MLIIEEIDNKISIHKENQHISKIMYCIDDSYLSIVYSNLRPWVYLELGDGWYKNCKEVINYFKHGKYKNCIEDNRGILYTNEVKNIIKNYEDSYKLLYNLGLLREKENINIDLEPSLITYECDIYNLLSDYYGEDYFNCINSYLLLNIKEKEFLYKLSTKKTKETISSFINTEINLLSENIISFLPEWFRLQLKIFKSKEDIIEKITPEFKNSQGIIKTPKYELKNLIYKFFLLGYTYSGDFIKTGLQKIYSESGIEKTAKIIDLYEYFDISKDNSSQESKYRLEKRKFSFKVSQEN